MTELMKEQGKKHVMKHALIFGSSGIVGFNLSKYMLLNHDWKVTGVAKKEYVHCPKGLDVIYCDLLNLENSKNCFSDTLKTITHAFFVSWVPGKSCEEEVEINSKLFSNAMEILKDAPLLKYCYLQTGTRYYGMNCGPIESPYKESQQRLDSPMFYYQQEDLLKKMAKERKGLKWTIARPPTILGFTLDNAMNFGTSMAIYATIMKELGQPLIFPGSEKAFHALREFVDVGLLCRFILWSQSHEFTSKQAFNITNGECVRAENFWPLIAEYFGMDWKMADKGFCIADFMKDKEDIWRKVIQRNGLHDINLNSIQTFQFLDLILMRVR